MQRVLAKGDNLIVDASDLPSIQITSKPKMESPINQLSL